MTVPNQSSHADEKALPTGTETHSTEAGEQSRGTSVALIHNWPLSILSLCLMPILLSLGFWQLDRGEEKRQMLADIDTRLAAQPQELNTLHTPQQYVAVRALGYYTDEYFYLDNRIRNGKVGYEILQVFVSKGQRWLVNRGWIAAGNDRAQLPDVDYPLAAKIITGFIYPNDDSTGAAEQQPVASAEPGARVQSLENALTDSLNLRNPQWHIRLSADSDSALVTDWRLVNTQPERHRAYALQWFAMATALLILWLLAATDVRGRVFRKRLNRTQ
ncbi:SURF1 family protein [Microbulbifer sp.]|uniref:SURF1 family protein n=1 Tax=Microbulbifer sp. TaxID=1908541 RepID=UPI00258E9FBB|nr:SURF1 family protein [Microbulbifer sp.]